MLHTRKQVKGGRTLGAEVSKPYVPFLALPPKLWDFVPQFVQLQFLYCTIKINNMVCGDK